MTEAIRIQDPNAFLIPGLTELALSALGTSPLVPDPQAALLELVDKIAHPALGLFVVLEGDRLTAIALAEHNDSALSPGCGVLHFYNRGSNEARKALIDALAGFAREGGFTKLWGIDTGRRPGAFARLFRALGPAEPQGQLFEFDLTEGDA